ncbi:hypothetical protein C8R44DRAFT_865321 [Mycena epipterygia]|nr:hypothetical protein C8R44DRAFT_865321 [Mycena epipterygia]
MQVLFILAAATSALAMIMPQEIEGRATIFTTGAPLTVNKTLSPSPTETGSAVSSAYSQVVQLCGTPVDRTLQDALAVYNNVRNFAVPVTNISDPTFVEWAFQQYPYTLAIKTCEGAELVLDGVIDSVTEERAGPTNTAAPASATASGGSGSGRQTPSATGSSDAPSPTKANGTRMMHGHTGVFGAASFLALIGFLVG